MLPGTHAKENHSSCPKVKADHAGAYVHYKHATPVFVAVSFLLVLIPHRRWNTCKQGSWRTIRIQIFLYSNTPNGYTTHLPDMTLNEAGIEESK